MMDKKMLKHNDCKNFVAVDVVKGICRLNNQLVFIDTDICPKFEQLPKCKNCFNFSNANKDNIGNCDCSKAGYWTYADNIALNCVGYQKTE